MSEIQQMGDIIKMVSKNRYFKLVSMIERLHRLFQEVVKVELDRLNIRDITNVQAIILYNIGKNIVSAGDIQKLGYYKGINVSYNLSKLVENNYLIRWTNSYDARSKSIEQSRKGMDLHAKLDELFTIHTEAFDHKGLDIDSTLHTFLKLENFWADLIGDWE